MEWWQPIVLGAGIALLSGPLTELVKSYFTFKKEQEERRRTFQRDNLLQLQEALTRMSVAASVAIHLAREHAEWPNKMDSEWVQEFEKSGMEVHRFRVLVSDQLVRDASLLLVQVNMRVLASKSELEADEQLGDESNLYMNVNERIGELIRQL